MKKLTLKKAYELSVKKWAWIVAHNGDDNNLAIELPELEKLKAGCGYCHYFMVQHPGLWCEGCPIGFKASEFRCHCLSKRHPYMTWYHYGTKKAAQAVLQRILDNKPNFETDETSNL